MLGVVCVFVLGFLVLSVVVMLLSCLVLSVILLSCWLPARTYSGSGGLSLRVALACLSLSLLSFKGWFVNLVVRAGSHRGRSAPGENVSALTTDTSGEADMLSSKGGLGEFQRNHCLFHYQCPVPAWCCPAPSWRCQGSVVPPPLMPVQTAGP